ncbi:MAG TPA: DUF5683 domain-containing protein [Puia sp.]|nr:DUF5683 domain-containing protein [Puia sp.]
MRAFFILVFVILFFSLHSNAQQKDSTHAAQISDSALEKRDSMYKGTRSQATMDSIELKQRKNYRRATLYSTILPGAGQFYNKKYWKIPIVYAAIGIPAYLYFDNKKIYNEAQYALVVTINGSKGDSLSNVSPDFLPLVQSGNTTAIINVRDEARKDEDYSILFFLLFYGLNILDATVDAHLKDFNVNSDLSFRIKPMIMPGPTPSAGITLAFDIHKPRPRPLYLN